MDFITCIYYISCDLERGKKHGRYDSRLEFICRYVALMRATWTCQSNKSLILLDSKLVSLFTKIGIHSRNTFDICAKILNFVISPPWSRQWVIHAFENPTNLICPLSGSMMMNFGGEIGWVSRTVYLLSGTDSLEIFWPSHPLCCIPHWTCNYIILRPASVVHIGNRLKNGHCFKVSCIPNVLPTQF